jgi:hypothetical protein
MAPRSGEEGRSAYARWPVGPRAPRPYGRIGFSKTIDSGTAARPGNPRRLPGIGDETTLNMALPSIKMVLGWQSGSNPLG